MQEQKYYDAISKLKIDCTQCSGLCCVALYCAKSDGFPADKAAGTPCRNLTTDFRCAIHPDLAKRNMHGCLTYDCFGAGQAVTQLYGAKANWRTHAACAVEVFKTFLTVFQLHQMLWYLWEAKIRTALPQGDIEQLILENERVTKLPPDLICGFDLQTYRARVNALLKRTIREISICNPAGEVEKDFAGKNLTMIDLQGQDLSMAWMMAADLRGCCLRKTTLLGADLRDANLQDADLRECLFLTQLQLNSAKGNANTKIPSHLSQPVFWIEAEPDGCKREKERHNNDKKAR